MRILVIMVLCCLAGFVRLAHAVEEISDGSAGWRQPASKETLRNFLNDGYLMDQFFMAAQDTPRRIIKIRYNHPLPNFLSFVEFISELDRSDVILLGEEHDDPASHRLELDVVRSVDPDAVAMEMFERDIQPELDAYLTSNEFDPAGLTELETKFLGASRPWNNYQADYRPIIEASRHHLGTPHIYGSNAPTPIARRVAKEGLDAVLTSLSPEERGWVAETTTSPKDEYWQRFLAAMGGGASDAAHGMGMNEEQIYGFYQAQCLKDDTMAETIAKLRAEDPQRQVVHLSGSFHIDYHLGIYPRLVQCRPQDKIVTVAIRPVENFEEATLQAALQAEPGVADYVVFVLKEEPTKS